MIITKGVKNRMVRFTTTRHMQGWTVAVEVEGILVHPPLEDIYITEDDALRAADAFAGDAIPTLH